jgi:hypothetical protein
VTKGAIRSCKAVPEPLAASATRLPVGVLGFGRALECGTVATPTVVGKMESIGTVTTATTRGARWGELQPPLSARRRESRE